MRKYYEENISAKNFQDIMLSVPEDSKKNSYSKPLDLLDLLPRLDMEIGSLNNKVEKMELKL